MNKHLKKIAPAFAAVIIAILLGCSISFAAENDAGVSGETSPNKVIKSATDRILKKPETSGNSRFPVNRGSRAARYGAGTTGPVNAESLAKQKKLFQADKENAGENKNGNFSTASMSPEKRREAYEAGYARSPVSPYAGLPSRLRNVEPYMMDKPEWDKKYRANSFKGSRPVELSVNPAVMKPSQGNPNYGGPGRKSPQSVVIEKETPLNQASGNDSSSIVNGQNVRILLKRVSGSVTIETGAGLLVAGGSDMVGVTRVNGKMTLDAVDGKIMSEDKQIGDRICQIKPSLSSIKVDGKPYRGHITIYAEEGTLTVVNSLPMEAYLLGVVAAEMPASWGEEALKAQAVASRSYALFHLDDNGDDRMWDLEDTEADQVYGGMDAEKPQTTLAVYATKGQVILYGGRPAEALFHADSGGYTDSPGDVWKKDYPYLRSVNDKFTAAGGPFTWEYYVQGDRFFSKLRSAGIKTEPGDDVRISEKTTSGRVIEVSVGGTTVHGNRLRQILDPKQMKSAKYEVTKQGDGFLFSGKGYGHGVGLSQNGAKQMAEMGYSYRDILKFYYKGVCIGRMNSVLYANRDNQYRKKEIYQ